MRRLLVLVAGLVSVACAGASAQAAGTGVASPTGTESAFAKTIASFPKNSWAAIGGDLSNTRYSTLTQINKSNVGRLKRIWATEINPGFRTGGVQTLPTVVGNRLFAGSSRGTPAMLNAATGELLWNSDPSTRETATGAARGLSVGAGKLFAGQGDGTLTAFDLATGKIAWKTLINTGRVPTYQPAAPIYFDGMVYTSLSGNDLGKLRGGIFAYDANTGALKWTFWISPLAGTPGANTWGDPKELETGGGGVWTYGAIDPQLKLLYEPTGNPSPDFGRKPGRNLYTDAIIALDLKTGKLRWYFQTVHHDQWDYDCASPPILYNVKVKGKLKRGLHVTCKSGYVYHLDRATGKPLVPVRERPAPNAATMDAATRAYVEKEGWSRTQPIPQGDSIIPRCVRPEWLPGPAPDGKPYEYSCTFANVGPDHFVAHMVSISGATNYWPAAYNAKLGYAYICATVNLESVKAVPGAPSPLGAIAPGLAGQVFAGNGGFNGASLTGTQLNATFTALNVRNNKKVWQKEYRGNNGIGCRGGTSTTASGLVFMADLAGVLHAYDAANGRELWRYETPEGMVVNTAPAFYMINGKQYMAWNVNLGAKIGTPQVGKNTVIAFAL